MKTDRAKHIAKEIKADLIVIGSHSKKWLDKLLIGSTTEKVLRHTEIPMLIIPTKGQLYCQIIHNKLSMKAHWDERYNSEEFAYGENLNVF